MKLSTVRICLDCEEIFEPRNLMCPACGSRYWFFLSTWLNEKKPTLKDRSRSSLANIDLPNTTYGWTNFISEHPEAITLFEEWKTEQEKNR